MLCNVDWITSTSWWLHWESFFKFGARWDGGGGVANPRKRPSTHSTEGVMKHNDSELLLLFQSKLYALCKKCIKWKRNEETEPICSPTHTFHLWKTGRISTQYGTGRRHKKTGPATHAQIFAHIITILSTLQKIAVLSNVGPAVLEIPVLLAQTKCANNGMQCTKFGIPCLSTRRHWRHIRSVRKKKMRKAISVMSVPPDRPHGNRVPT